MNINNTNLFAITALATLLVGFPGICQAQTPAEATKTTAEASKTKRVMVVTFQQLDRKVKDNIPLGQEVADRVTQNLVMKGARVVERADLASIEKERGLNATTTDNKGSVQELARLKGATVAVMGKITEFNIVEKQSTAGGEAIKSLLGRVKPLKDKGVGKQYELRISLDARLVSVETGEILAATTVLVTEGTDESDINSLLTKSFGGAELLKLGLSAVLGNRKPEQESQETAPADKNAAWNESQAGKCTERAIQQLVNRLMEKIPLAAETDIEDMKVSALQFQGLGDYSEATQIISVLEKLSGIAGAELKNYTPETTEITVRGSAKALKAIVGSLLADESLKPFNLRVASATQEGVVFKKS